MNRDVTEHDGIKYSLQPHGISTKVICAFFTFVLKFGAAFSVVAPAHVSISEELKRN